MHWQYLATKPYDLRYLIVAEHLPTEGKTILDLNCGQGNFRHYINCKEYFANDVFVPENTEGMTFLHKRDTEIDFKTDIISLFGYGGGEVTGEPLESKEAGNTLIRLATKYQPEYIVLEMVQKWEDEHHIMTNLKNRLTGYRVLFEQRINIEPVNHYHDKRLIIILKLCKKLSS